MLARRRLRDIPVAEPLACADRLSPITRIRSRAVRRAAYAIVGIATLAAAGIAIAPRLDSSGAATARVPDAHRAASRERAPTPSPGPDSAGNATSGGIYAAATATRVGGRLARVPARVYVPNSDAGTLDVIDPKRLRVIRRFPVGAIPHHVTPSWDLRWLYVTNTASNSLTVIDPRKGKPVRTLPVPDPYNLYFTPDGSKAIVVAEREQRLDFRHPRTWRLLGSVGIPWPGVDHLDFSADGRYLLASAEFSGMVVRVDVEKMKVTGKLAVGGAPIDVKLAPGGSVFYVANQGRSGVSIVDPIRMKEIRFLKTGTGAHGLAVSRDARSLYVGNRLAGSISVIDLRRRRVRDTWPIGGSPDMLQVSPGGRQLWASGRFHSSVYVVDTRTGRLLRTIGAGAGAHGLTYFPQPGRFSVGHNGVYR
jgi:DNA-binding beta-propeller fold protein YncE